MTRARFKIDQKPLYCTKKNFNKWLNAWPVRFPNGRFRCYFLPISKVMRLRSCWQDRGKSLQLRSYYKKIILKDWGAKRHHVQSLARNTIIFRPAILLHGGKIWDGNHTVLALWHQGYRGQIFVLENI